MTENTKSIQLLKEILQLLHNENEKKFLEELTQLSYKYQIVIAKTTDNQLLPLEMSSDEKRYGGCYQVLKNDNNKLELVFC